MLGLLVIAGCQPLTVAQDNPAKQPWNRPRPTPAGSSDYGRGGALATPTARFDPPGSFRLAVAARTPYRIASITAQPLPALSLGYRRTQDTRTASRRGFGYSGGLDAKLLLSEEGEFAPQLALGIDALAGDGLFGSEYLVASKQIGHWDLSLGLGWGRLAGGGGLVNPLALLGGHFTNPERRQEADRGPDTWFSGDRIGLFGSARYRLPRWVLAPLPWLAPDQRASLILEYDSDQWQAERRFDPNLDPGPLPINAGLDLPLGQGLRLGIGIEHLNTLVTRLSWAWQPSRRKPLTPGDTGTAPRQPATAAKPAQPASHSTTAVWLDSRTVRPDQLATRTLEQAAQAASAPAQPDQVDLRLHHGGVPTLALTMQGQSLRKLANGDAAPAEIWHESTRRSLQIAPPDDADGAAPWQVTLSPRGDLDAFEASSAVVTRGMLDLSAEYARHGTIAGGTLRLNLADNLDRLAQDRTTVPLPVRSDIARFADHAIWPTNLYLADIEHLFPDLYVAGSAGLFDEQYAGAGTELLYWPVDARWALGLDLTQAIRRDPAQPFAITADSVLTGELAGYYRFPEGSIGKLALVNYLGGDSGLRLDLSTPLANGWVLDSYLAFSDAESLAADNPLLFAELGGADFGLRLRAPTGRWLDGLVTLMPILTIRPLGRDQAQSLERPVRLYDHVSRGHLGTLLQHWPGMAN